MWTPSIIQTYKGSLGFGKKSDKSLKNHLEPQKINLSISFNLTLLCGTFKSVYWTDYKKSSIFK